MALYHKLVTFDKVRVCFDTGLQIIISPDVLTRPQYGLRQELEQHNREHEIQLVQTVHISTPLLGKKSKARGKIGY